MISTLYGSFGATTGIVQGLILGFRRLSVPLTARAPADPAKHSASELVADCSERDPSLEVLLLPLLVVGHASVGKTTLLNAYLHGQDLSSPEPTLGADLSVKQLCVRNQHVSLQIWDTAGENQADLLDSYFWSNASGALIVCNLHQANCTKCLNFWQEKMHQDAPGLPIVVFAVKHGHNKLFQPEHAQLEEQLVAQWCSNNDSCLFMAAGPCVQPPAEQAFSALVDKALLHLEEKTKPVFKPFSPEAYPSLLLLQTAHAVELDSNS